MGPLTQRNRARFKPCVKCDTHYFQPGREDFRQTLQAAMPRLLTNGHRTSKEEMGKLIDAVKPKALRERLLKVWGKW